MTDSECKTEILVSFEQTNEENYILGVLPQNRDDDYYYEVFISTRDSAVKNLAHSLGENIYIEIKSPKLMEIWEGQFEGDRDSEGEFQYKSYSRAKTEKANRREWKPKLQILESNYKSIFKEKLGPYGLMRSKIIENFKNIYDTEISKLHPEKRSKLQESSIFKILYRTYDSNPTWDTFNQLINPDFLYYPPILKDWKEDYQKIEESLIRLKNLEVENYTLLNHHIIAMYKRTFEHMFPSFLMNYPNSDPDLFTTFFNSIMKHMGSTKGEE